MSRTKPSGSSERSEQPRPIEMGSSERSEPQSEERERIESLFPLKQVLCGDRDGLFVSMSIHGSLW